MPLALNCCLKCKKLPNLGKLFMAHFRERNSRLKKLVIFGSTNSSFLFWQIGHFKSFENFFWLFRELKMTLLVTRNTTRKGNLNWNYLYESIIRCFVGFISSCENDLERGRFKYDNKEYGYTIRQFYCTIYGGNLENLSFPLNWNKKNCYYKSNSFRRSTFLLEN